LRATQGPRVCEGAAAGKIERQGAGETRDEIAFHDLHSIVSNALPLTCTWAAGPSASDTSTSAFERYLLPNGQDKNPIFGTRSIELDSAMSGGDFGNLVKFVGVGDRRSLWTGRAQLGVSPPAGVADMHRIGCCDAITGRREGCCGSKTAMAFRQLSGSSGQFFSAFALHRRSIASAVGDGAEGHCFLQKIYK
jgi:hypothetical protein